MKVYKSKIGTGILSFIILIIGGTTIPMIYYKMWIGVIINLLVSLFIWHLFSTTYYAIKENVLIIKSGFLFSESIKIDKIRKISESRNPISSPANSLDRLEIIYEERNSILISPKEKIDFLETLKVINPKIEITLRNLNDE